MDYKTKKEVLSVFWSALERENVALAKEDLVSYC